MGAAAMLGFIGLAGWLWWASWSDISNPIFLGDAGTPDNSRYGNWLPDFFPSEAASMTLYRHTDYSLSLIHCALPETAILRAMKPGAPRTAPRKSVWPRRLLSLATTHHGTVYVESPRSLVQGWYVCRSSVPGQVILWQELEP
ncbi:MAG: hypothetical protein J0L84_14825 [Verrucomicrobia bacterium]|nr:hypothetical protein [Verrucomicrobiota bacterium]